MGHAMQILFTVTKNKQNKTCSSFNSMKSCKQITKQADRIKILSSTETRRALCLLAIVLLTSGEKHEITKNINVATAFHEQPCFKTSFGNDAI